MNKSKFLEWDTNFFGFKIAKLTIDNIEELNNSIKYLFDNNYNLIYGYSDVLIDNVVLLHQYNGKLVDKKVTLAFDVIDHIKFENNKEIEDVSRINDCLIKLSIESGYYSRFKLDSNFQSSKFEEMYTKWIENSVSRKIADHVLVFNKNKGVLTLKHSKNNYESMIGLLAVDEKSRGEKIGTKLIDFAKNKCKESNMKIIKVTTQLDNEVAMKFYKHNGFQIEKVEYIYHFWLK